MVKVALLTLSLLAFTTEIATARSDRVNSLPTPVIAKEAKKVIRNGGTYSVRHGDCKPYLKRLSYELVQRAFPARHRAWALYVVERESGFCPGAVNTTYSNPCQRATGLSQMIPCDHPWVNYKRVVRDPKYAVAVFAKLSKRGSYQQPWCLPCFS